MRNIQVPVFNPILLDLPGPLAVSWYGLTYLMGFVFAYVFVWDHIRRQRIVMTNDQFMEILIRIFIGVLVGGRLGFVLFVNPAYYFQNPLQIFAVWEGGMYFFGGFIMAVILPYFYIRKQDLNYFDLADFIIIPAPIGLAFGRLGNFINGEFWGRPSASPLAMVFDSVQRSNWLPVSDPLAREIIEETGMTVLAGQSMVNLPRHPVQLYELVLNGIVLYAILLLFRNIGRAKPRGSVASLFLLGYGVFRFWVEFYREPVSHSAIIAGDWFTLSMLFAIPMIVLGAVGLIISYRKNQENLLYRAVI
jgi:phosphatidylglycerol:prolipoprotein diacylglycerol transferase